MYFIISYNFILFCFLALVKAFPCISTGIYGYPSHEAAPVAIKTVRTFLESNFDKVMYYSTNKNYIVIRYYY